MPVEATALSTSSETNNLGADSKDTVDSHLAIGHVMTKVNSSIEKIAAESPAAETIAIVAAATRGIAILTETVDVRLSVETNAHVHHTETTDTGVTNDASDHEVTTPDVPTEARVPIAATSIANAATAASAASTI